MDIKMYWYRRYCILKCREMIFMYLASSLIWPTTHLKTVGTESWNRFVSEDCNFTLNENHIFGVRSTSYCSVTVKVECDRYHSLRIPFSLSLDDLESLDFVLDPGVHWLLFGPGIAFDKCRFSMQRTKSWTVRNQVTLFLILRNAVCNTT